MPMRSRRCFEHEWRRRRLRVLRFRRNVGRCEQRREAQRSDAQLVEGMHARRRRHEHRADERRRVDVHEAERADDDRDTRDVRNAQPDQPKPISRRRGGAPCNDDLLPLPPVPRPCSQRELNTSRREVSRGTAKVLSKITRVETRK